MSIPLRKYLNNTSLLLSALVVAELSTILGVSSTYLVMAVLLVSPFFFSSIDEYVRYLLLAHVVLLSEWSVGLSDTVTLYSDFKTLGVHFSYLIFVLYVAVKSSLKLIWFMLLFLMTYLLIGLGKDWLLLDVQDDLRIYGVFSLLIVTLVACRRYWDFLPYYIMMPMALWFLMVTVFNIRYEYAPGMQFYAASCVLTFMPILISKLVKERLILMVMLMVLLFNDGYYLGGKWIIYSALALVSIRPIFFGTLAIFSVPMVVALLPGEKLYRISQLIELTDFNMHGLMKKSNSIGNVTAEIVTLHERSLGRILFGNGFGSGLSDYYGLLKNMAGGGGYDLQRLQYGTYNKLHLGFSDVLLKFGYVGILGMSITLRKGLVLLGFFLFGTANKETFIFLAILFLYDSSTAAKV